MDPLFPYVLFYRWMEIQSRWIRSDLRANEYQLYESDDLGCIFLGYGETSRQLQKRTLMDSFTGNYETADVVDIPLIDNIHPRKDFMPMAVPEDIAERLIRLHGNPFVWFTGQLIKYLLRPQPWLLEFVQKKAEAIKFETPMVGYASTDLISCQSHPSFCFSVPEFMCGEPTKSARKQPFTIFRNIWNTWKIISSFINIKIRTWNSRNAFI